MSGNVPVIKSQCNDGGSISVAGSSSFLRGRYCLGTYMDRSNW
jgi:hypothetical protein